MFTLRFTLWSVGLPVTFPNKKFWLKFPDDRFSITVGQDTGAEEGLVERRTYPPCNSSPVDQGYSDTSPVVQTKRYCSKTLQLNKLKVTFVTLQASPQY